MAVVPMIAVRFFDDKAFGSSIDGLTTGGGNINGVVVVELAPVPADGRKGEIVVQLGKIFLVKVGIGPAVQGLGIRKDDYLSGRFKEFLVFRIVFSDEAGVYPVSGSHAFHGVAFLNPVEDAGDRKDGQLITRRDYRINIKISVLYGLQGYPELRGNFGKGVSLPNFIFLQSLAGGNNIGVGVGDTDSQAAVSIYKRSFPFFGETGILGRDEIQIKGGAGFLFRVDGAAIAPAGFVLI